MNTFYDLNRITFFLIFEKVNFEIQLFFCSPKPLPPFLNKNSKISYSLYISFYASLFHILFSLSMIDIHTILFILSSPHHTSFHQLSLSFPHNRPSIHAIPSLFRHSFHQQLLPGIHPHLLFRLPFECRRPRRDCPAPQEVGVLHSSALSLRRGFLGGQDPQGKIYFCGRKVHCGSQRP